jgi:hypothetical protein
MSRSQYLAVASLIEKLEALKYHRDCGNKNCEAYFAGVDDSIEAAHQHQAAPSEIATDFGIRTMNDAWSDTLSAKGIPSSDEKDAIVEAVEFALINAEPFSQEEVIRVAIAKLTNALPIEKVTQPSVDVVEALEIATDRLFPMDSQKDGIECRPISNAFYDMLRSYFRQPVSLEKAARALCQCKDIDPDGVLYNGKPNWTMDVGEARAVLNAVGVKYHD